VSPVFALYRKEMEDVNWTGVWIPDGLQLVSIAPEAKAVMQHCYGGYTTNLTLEEFTRPENYLVHTLEGQPLPVGPVRTLIPHPYAWSFPPEIN
jgi:DMSO/TMAO reductase YedYZ molybdopterin-dependent catalytic subunit